jgi:hypothetical protein
LNHAYRITPPHTLPFIAFPNFSPSIGEFSSLTLQCSRFLTQVYLAPSSTHPTPRNRSGS